MSGNLAEARSHDVPPEVFLKHHQTLEALEAEKQAVADRIKAAKKAAKSSGMDLKAYADVKRLRKMDDDEQVIRLKNIEKMTKWLQMPIGTQIAMFGQEEVQQPHPEAVQEQRDWDAAERGKNTGEAGGMRAANPFGAGSSEYVAWDKAWVKGNKKWLGEQKSRAKTLGDNAAAQQGSGRGRRSPMKASSLLEEAEPALH